MNSRKRFTLVEILVVIVVMVMLVGMLLAVLGKSREKSRSAQCLNNLKQVGTALQMYSSEYDGYVTPNHWGSGTNTWADNLYGFANDERVLNCPSAKTAKWTFHNETNFTYTLANVYGFDADNQIFERHEGLARIAGLPAADLTALCGDGRNGFQAYGDTVTHATVDGIYQWETSQGWFTARHMEGYTFTMLDGHAEWLAKREIDKLGSTGNYLYFARNK